MVYPSQGYERVMSFYSRADSLHRNMPSFHWDRILVGITCCVVTVTLWALCIWQLVLRFKIGKKYNSTPFDLYLSSLGSFPFLKYLNMIADKYYYIHAVRFLGRNIFLLTQMYKEVPQTLRSAVKQDTTANNLWRIFLVTYLHCL